MRLTTAPFAALFIAALAGAAPPGLAQRSFGPGRCGPIDPTYARTASATGGQVFPAAPSEMVQLSAFIAESSRSDSTMILWAGGTVADAQAGFIVPVDRSVRRLMLSITFDGTGGTAEIVTPTGAVVETGAGPGDTIFSCGRILIVDAPEPGPWRVTPAPSSQFWVVAHARSDRDLQTAEFVRRGGRPGHEGLFRINGSPLAGRPAILRIALSEPEERPVFELFSAQGRVVQRVALERVGDDVFVGEIALPAVPFRVGVSATDADGGRYQRVDRRLFHAESMEVVPPELDQVTAGADRAVVFTLRNYGEQARYRVTATVAAEVLTRVEPPVVDLAPASEQRVTVWVPARILATARPSLELLVVASSDDAAASSVNNAFLRLTVVQP